MNPEHLITFSVVAELQSISRAADVLHITQPAVSGQLKLLQERVGEPLYLREGRGIRLTAAGEGLLEHARRIRGDLEEARAYCDRLKGIETGSIGIGASTTVMSYFLPHLIADFGRLHPHVRVSVTAGNTMEIVEKLPVLDLGFVEGPIRATALFEIIPWREDEVVAVIRRDHPLAGRGRVALSEILNHPLIYREAGSGVRQLIENAIDETGLEAHVALELTGVEAVKEAVRAEMGIGFVSSMSLRHEDALLVGLGMDPPLCRMLSILVPPPDRRSRVSERFMKHCLDFGN